MPAGVTANISLSIAASLTALGDFWTPQAPVKIDKALNITAGTDGLDKADILWADERTLAASATENLDLAGVLAGLLGGPVTAAEITAIYIEAAEGNTNDVVAFGAASNAFNGPLSGTTPKLTLGPGDAHFTSNRKGMPVTAGTGDIILVANSAGGSAVTYKIALIGRTVAA